MAVGIMCCAEKDTFKKNHVTEVKSSLMISRYMFEWEIRQCISSMAVRSETADFRICVGVYRKPGCQEYKRKKVQSL